MSPFDGKLLSSTLLWCYLVFNFTQFVILESLSVLDLALSEVKGLIHSISEPLLLTSTDLLLWTWSF